MRKVIEDLLILEKSLHVFLVTTIITILFYPSDDIIHVIEQTFLLYWVNHREFLCINCYNNIKMLVTTPPLEHNEFPLSFIQPKETHFLEVIVVFIMDESPLLLEMFPLFIEKYYQNYSEKSTNPLNFFNGLL